MTRVAHPHPRLRAIRGGAHCQHEAEVRAHFDREAESGSERDMEILYLHAVGCHICNVLWRQLEAEEERRFVEAEAFKRLNT